METIIVPIIIPILISLVILGIAIAIITRPLYIMKTEKTSDADLLKVALNTEYQQILNRIRELEQEYLEEKLNDGDYHDRRGTLNREAADILKQLESGHTNQP
jgi:hypothetical protein